MNPTSLTNERLCALAQKGDEAAREILVEKNMGFNGIPFVPQKLRNFPAILEHRKIQTNPL